MMPHAKLSLDTYAPKSSPFRGRGSVSFPLCDSEPLEIIVQTLLDSLEVEGNSSSVVQSFSGLSGNVGSYHH